MFEKKQFVWIFLLMLTCGSRMMAQQPIIQITSPANDAAVKPGQTILVKVSVSPGVHFPQVLLIATPPLEDVGPLVNAPYQFSLHIPINLPCGRYHLTAVGIDASGKQTDSGTISISVEPVKPVVRLAVEPKRLDFETIGEQIPLIVTGTLSDGSDVDLTESSLTAYASSNMQSVIVSSAGLTTAVRGSGSGGVNITVQRGSLSVKMPARVP